MRVESSSSRLVQLRVASVEHKRVDHGQRLGWFVERHHVARTSDAEPSSLPTVPLHHVSAHPSLAVYCPRPPRLLDWEPKPCRPILPKKRIEARISVAVIDQASVSCHNLQCQPVRKWMSERNVTRANACPRRRGIQFGSNPSTIHSDG